MNLNTEKFKMWPIYGNLITILIATSSVVPSDLLSIVNGSKIHNIDEGINNLVGIHQNNTHMKETSSSLESLNEVHKGKIF